VIRPRIPAADFFTRLLGSIRPAGTERRLEEEIGFHVDMQAAKNERMGMTPDEARRHAMVSFGGQDRCKEIVRDGYRHRPIENVFQDLRYSARSLRAVPAYALAAVLALGIGMGSVTGVFTLLNTVVLRTLAYAHPERLVMILETNRDKGLNHELLSPVNFVDYRSMSDIFDDAAAWWVPTIDLTDDENGDAVRVSGVETTANLFSVLGVHPVLGSAFTMDSALRGKNGEAMISNRLWKSRFGGDTSIAGRTVRMNGELYTIVGVMPAGFDFPGKTDVWQLLEWDLRQHSRGAHFMGTVASLKLGVSVDRADRALDGLTARLASEHRETNLGWGARVVSLDREIEGSFRPALFALLAASSLLLIIACINVANLMLARSTARGREVAVRGAVGASRQRIVALFLSESLILALGGTLVGLAVGALSVKGLLAWSPVEIPRADHVKIDVRVLLMALGAALVTTIAFGLGPALHVSRTHPGSAMRDGARGSQQEGRATRRILVIAQVALAVVLLSGAGLLIRSVSKLLHQDAGFDPSGVITGDVQLPANSYKDWDRVSSFYSDLLRSLRSRPDVIAAGASNYLPLETAYRLPLVVVGAEPVPKGDEPTAQFHTVDEGYFTAMRVSLVRGRTFSDRDLPTSPGVAVVNETLARRLWPGKDPIGKHVTTSSRVIGPLGSRLVQGDDHEIVGVVRDVRNTSLATATEPAIYFAVRQFPFRNMHLVVRGRGDAMAMSALLRAEVQRADPSLPVANVKTMTSVLAESLNPPRFVMVLFSAFALLALLLAALGVYGILTYLIGHRRREIGIRLALGERQHDILRMIVREGLGLALAGCLVGAAVALVASRLLTSFLYEVAPGDPATTTGVIALVATVALAACLIPGRSASALDPVHALRAE